MFEVRAFGAAFLTSVLAFGGALAAPALQFSGSDSIQGVARDVLGNVLEGVEVLFLTEAAGHSPVAIVATNDEGHFQVPDLAPGVYRVAALKKGYLTYVGRVNTTLDRPLELLLRPSPQPGEGGQVLPEDASWALRLPRRRLLREQEQDVPLRNRDARDAPSAAQTAVYELLQLEIDQWFSLAESLPGTGKESNALEGMETDMRLAGALGHRGSVRLQGHHERLARSGDLQESGLSDRQSSSLLLGLLYDTGRDSNLAVRAFYGEHALDFVAPNQAGNTLHHGLRAWGYNAAWSKQLSSVSRVGVQVDYHDTTMDLPAGPAVAEQRPATAGATEVNNRTVGAQGVYESLATDRHQISVGFRAQFADAPLAWSAGTPHASAVQGPATAGWSLRLNAEDSWAISSPVTLTYGLGYRHSLAREEASLLVPRLGGVWSSHWASARLLLSYYAPFWQGPSGDGAPPISFQLERPWGYDAEVEVPVVDSVRVKGAVSFAPMQFDYFGYDPGEPSGMEPPIYATGGRAAAKRTSLGLAHESPWIITTFEAAHGTAEGRLAAVSPLTAPVRRLSDNRVSFRDGSVGVQIVPWGTKLFLDYLRIEESSLLDPEARTAFEEESVELRLIQDLIHSRALHSSWRLLLALRLADLEAAAEDFPYYDRPIASASHRLSAGVSVAF